MPLAFTQEDFLVKTAGRKTGILSRFDVLTVLQNADFYDRERYRSVKKLEEKQLLRQGTR